MEEGKYSQRQATITVMASDLDAAEAWAANKSLRRQLIWHRCIVYFLRLRDEAIFSQLASNKVPNIRSLLMTAHTAYPPVNQKTQAALMLLGDLERHVFRRFLMAYADEVPQILAQEYECTVQTRIGIQALKRLDNISTLARVSGLMKMPVRRGPQTRRPQLISLALRCFLADDRDRVAAFISESIYPLLRMWGEHGCQHAFPQAFDAAAWDAANMNFERLLAEQVSDLAAREELRRRWSHPTLTELRQEYHLCAVKWQSQLAAMFLSGQGAISARTHHVHHVESVGLESIPSLVGPSLTPARPPVPLTEPQPWPAQIHVEIPDDMRDPMFLGGPGKPLGLPLEGSQVEERPPTAVAEEPPLTAEENLRRIFASLNSSSS